MKKILFLFFAIIFSISSMAQWGRSNLFTIRGEYDDSTKPMAAGLEKIIVFKNFNGASISYETASSNTVKIYTYENSIGDKTPIAFTTSSVGNKTTYTVSNLLDNRGLLIDDNNKMLAVWIIDYSQHPANLQSIEAVEAADKCEALKLFVTQSGSPLQYYGTTGQMQTIKRRYDLEYKNLKWNSTDYRFEESEKIIADALNGTEIILSGDDLPLIDTEFVLKGDQFAKKFNQSSSISTHYQSVAVQAHLQTIQAAKNAENEGQGGVELGGSAPVDIDFFGYGNEPTVYFYTWFVYNKKDMNNPIARYTDKDFSYTFNQAGDYEVVLEVANGESSCVATANTSFNIVEYDLKIPNFFSPGNSASTNAEFRVYYKSIIKYHIVIFNRWGNKVWESRDPAQGWDGRYGGRYVNPGVYFYSIEATGSGDEKIKRGGDINVLH